MTPLDPRGRHAGFRRSDDAGLRRHGAEGARTHQRAYEGGVGSVQGGWCPPGGDRGYRPTAGPDSGAATVARRVAAERAAHRLLFEPDRLREAGITSRQALARALSESGVPTPRGGDVRTHTTVGRLLARTETQSVHAVDPFPLPA
jgi:hypothetical protein